MKRGSNNESYQNRLKEIGIISDLYADQWEQKCTLLLQYKEREGH